MSIWEVPSNPKDNDPLRSDSIELRPGMKEHTYFFGSFSVLVLGLRDIFCSRSVLVLNFKNFSCSCSVLVREHVPEQYACSFIPDSD